MLITLCIYIFSAEGVFPYANIIQEERRTEKMFKNTLLIDKTDKPISLGTQICITAKLSYTISIKI